MTVRRLDTEHEIKPSTGKIHLAFTHHGASGVGAGRCTDLWGES